MAVGGIGEGAAERLQRRGDRRQRPPRRAPPPRRAASGRRTGRARWGRPRAGRGRAGHRWCGPSARPGFSRRGTAARWCPDRARRRAGGRCADARCRRARAWARAAAVWSACSGVSASTTATSRSVNCGKARAKARSALAPGQRGREQLVGVGGDAEAGGGEPAGQSGDQRGADQHEGGVAPAALDEGGEQAGKRHAGANPVVWPRRDSPSAPGKANRAHVTERASLALVLPSAVPPPAPIAADSRAGLGPSRNKRACRPVRSRSVGRRPYPGRRGDRDVYLIVGGNSWTGFE